MNKIILGAAVSAALLSGVAHAAPPVINPANTYAIYTSGTSAARLYIEKLLTDTTVPAAQRLCAGPSIVFKDSGSGTNQNAYYCVGNTANPALAPYFGTGNIPGTTTPKKTYLLMYKRSAGGSIYGVNPLVLDNGTSVPPATSKVDFLKIDATCTGTGPYTCAGVQSVTPDFGGSDVDPGKFIGTNYPLPAPAGWTPINAAGLTKLQVVSGPTQVFGMVANTFFFNQLKTTQAAVRPSLTTAQVANLLKGTYTPGAGLPALAAGKSLHICARVNGSGTKATSAIKFLNYPCVAGAVGPKADTGAAANGSQAVLVHQMSSHGDMEECLAELNAGTNTVGTKFNNIWGQAWAIGYAGTENNANGAKPYQFLKLNGIEPTLANVYNNLYKDWTELTFQYNKTHVFDTVAAYNTAEKAIVNEIIREAGNPVVLGNLDTPDATHTWGQSGLMGSPVFWTPPSAVLPKPVNRYSHATRTPALPVNDCKVPTIY
jgi:hypothetical protein